VKASTAEASHFERPKWWASRLLRVLGAACVAVILILGIWGAMYPEDSDPKSIKYVLWKAGAYPMNLDSATGTMIGDAKRDKLVVGRTRRELEAKFGYLLPRADASPYLRNCYENSSWKGRDVAFIRTSPWMVVFDGGNATKLVLIKGC
jgi:hypothetical protein